MVAARAPEQLTVTVTDSGAGLPPGFDLENTTSLGLQIVRTLVEGELGGRLSLRPRDGRRHDRGRRPARPLRARGHRGLPSLSAGERALPAAAVNRNPVLAPARRPRGRAAAASGA